MRFLTAVSLWGLLLTACSASGQMGAGNFDIVLSGGRVLDPDSGLDGIRNVAIKDGRIAAISVAPLTGAEVIDVSALVVAPGFIDLHAHGQDNVAGALQAMDGVTTALELEIGAFPITEAYAGRVGNSILNFGYSASHVLARTRVLAPKDKIAGFADIAATQTASPAEAEDIAGLLEQELRNGALGVGLALEYTPGAGRAEILRMFAVAAQHGAPIFAHARRGQDVDPAPEPALQRVQELIANAAITGASLHICHITSISLGDTAIVLEYIDSARKQGIDVSTEAYPYSAGSTDLGSAMFLPGWRDRLGGIDYQDLVWVETGERLAKSSFAKYRRQAMKSGPGMVIIHMIPGPAVRAAMSHPEVIIASDGLPWTTGREHPRGAGTYARVLGRFVREDRALDLMSAIAKMTVLPARRLESVTPQMRKKGRLQVGADADITVFDASAVLDRARYDSPMQASDGISYVLVNGAFIVRKGALVEGVFPGRAIGGPKANAEPD